MNAYMGVRCWFPPPPVLHLRMYSNWRDRLRAAVKRSGKKHSVIAMEAGIDPATLSRVLNGHIQPNFDTIVRIAHTVNENVGWLLDEHGFVLSSEEQRQLRKVARVLEDAALGHTTARERLQPNAVASGNAEIPRMFASRGVRVVYEASGDSMTGAGIFDRDLLFIKPTRSMREAAGRVVVCRLRDAEYVKVLDVRGGRTSLLSRNERYPPIDVADDGLELIGIVIGRIGLIPGSA